ncbi:DUF2399 domain-containing protein [Streptomyces iakyrus]|uniref:DUF2399 domain-containing protein n=1 Tax=Streptomyces iakyrus TaxID=68219 RepID=UPI0038146CB8
MPSVPATSTAPLSCASVGVSTVGLTILYTVTTADCRAVYDRDFDWSGIALTTSRRCSGTTPKAPPTRLSVLPGTLDS